MNSGIESFLRRESVWPDSYDDSLIDDIIWAQIENSRSAGDFASYLVHRPQRAKHMSEARDKYRAIDAGLDAEPACYFRAIDEIRSLAEGGNAGAMFHLGKIYSIGIAVEQNFPVAESWYLEAIELGEIRAHCNLGWLYQSGLGVREDKERAFKLLSIGAENGVPAAKASVAVMLLSGEGCRADPAQAINMLEAAFEDGYGNAANCLADAFFAGQHVAKDIDLAFEWLRRTAERGDVRTMAILGHYLVTGSHGRKDVARGVAYLFSAVNRGYSAAHLWLGALYEQGGGVERNPDMARMLFEKGAALGDEECAFALTRLSKGSVAPPESGSLSLN